MLDHDAHKNDFTVKLFSATQSQWISHTSLLLVDTGICLLI